MRMLEDPKNYRTCTIRVKTNTGLESVYSGFFAELTAAVLGANLDHESEDEYELGPSEIQLEFVDGMPANFSESRFTAWFHDRKGQHYLMREARCMGKLAGLTSTYLFRRGSNGKRS